MAIEVFNRYENKYVLDEAAFRSVYDRLLEHMEPDEYNLRHPFYSISNLYFDTKHDTLVRKSLAKPKYKEKLRLRAYGVPKENSKAFLELKKKVFGLVNKRRTALRLEEAYEFVRTSEPPELRDYMNRQVVSEIHYFLQRYDLAPKAYLAYDRKALFPIDNRDLRVTFDTNIRHRRTELRLEAGDHGEPLLPPGLWLMEVKAEKTIPLWLAKLLSEHRMFRTSFSKYGIEYRKYVAAGKMKTEEFIYA